MAWTPGLLLDYARALHVIVHQSDITLFKRIKQVFSSVLAIVLLTSLFTPFPAPAASLGLEGGSYETPYNDRGATNWLLPYVGLTNGNFYIDGTEAGYTFHGAAPDMMKFKVWYPATGYDSSKGRTMALRRLNDRDSPLFAGLSYLITTPAGGFQFSGGVDMLNQNRGVTMNASWILMKTWTNLTLIPVIGADWNNRRLNNYYYGISETESQRSGLRKWHPHASVIPFISLAANYSWYKRWNIWAELTGRYYSGTITKSPMVNKSAIAEFTLGFSYDF
jgi:outer membrane scaffolding protein for murein synthesis (MipA/OmpV family)